MHAVLLKHYLAPPSYSHWAKNGRKNAEDMTCAGMPLCLFAHIQLHFRQLQYICSQQIPAWPGAPHGARVGDWPPWAHPQTAVAAALQRWLSASSPGGD